MDHDSFNEDRAAILARRQRFIALAIGGLATACTPPETASDGRTTTVGSSTTGSSTSGETGTQTETETETGAGTETGTPSNFVPPTPRPCLSSQCDPFAQDCPDGEKCVPYASAAETLDANKCVPLEGEGAAGEPCVYGGTVLATDDCDESSHCWNAQDVDGTAVGVCTSFCEGTADDSLCDEGTACLIANNGNITLCLAECDPLTPDCGEGLGCSWTGQTFSCMVTTTGQPVGDPCGYANDCEPGSLCLDAAASPMCAGSACCVDYCAIDDPESCPDPQLECASFFTEDQAPAGLETLGVCVEPGACEGEDPDCEPALTIDS